MSVIVENSQESGSDMVVDINFNHAQDATINQ